MQRAICRGIFAPAQPDSLAASVRDFLSGAYMADIAGPNYFSARIETALQYSYGRGTKNLLGSIDTGKLTEEQARTIDHKWSPIRHHAKSFRGKSFEGESLQVYARTYARDLYLYPYATASEVPEMTAYFVLYLVLLCHEHRLAGLSSAAGTSDQSNEQADAQLMAQGRERVSDVALCAQDCRAGCNPREGQEPGGMRTFF